MAFEFEPRYEGFGAIILASLNCTHMWVCIDIIVVYIVAKADLSCKPFYMIPTSLIQTSIRVFLDLLVCTVIRMVGLSRKK